MARLKSHTYPDGKQQQRLPHSHMGLYARTAEKESLKLAKFFRQENIKQKTHRFLTTGETAAEIQSQMLRACDKCSTKQARGTHRSAAKSRCCSAKTHRKLSIKGKAGIAQTVPVLVYRR